MNALIDMLAQSPPMAIGVAAVFGLLVGSFLNVVILRLPKMIEAQWQAEIAEQRGEELAPQPAFNLVTPRSRCPKCGHQIRAWENIPVLSWLMLRGRCAGCGTAIPLRYPVVELAAGVLAAIAVWRFGASWAGLAAVGLTFALITLTVIDIDTQLLPDVITLPLLWAGLILNLWSVFTPLPDAVIGAVVGYLLLWSVYWLFKLATGKEGMGYGDFKLLAALGAWFGWKAVPAVILLSSVVGAAVGITLMLVARRGRDVPIPFGPYLAGAGLLTLYFRDPLVALFLPG
ncbi:MAG TPA: A24 family peptidase [Burkholderiaceae bacterium]|nr:A24 family peptidase [Burkholderiaceae bacterium]